MHSVIFVAKMPADRKIWGYFAAFADQKLQSAKGVLRLAENVWLLNLQESLAPLGELVSTAESRKVVYGLLPFEHAPEWLPAGSNPSTTLDHSVRN